ncbi:MAG TPA: hypothetical protein VMR77_01410 [Patescibacteria group bacterium]|nr:hypothetical protein [Patescibacteria group bacterium]
MKTRILLINFNEKEQEAVSGLGIDVDLGYLSDAYTAISPDGTQEQEASFYSPYAIYDYKAIFIRLTEKPPMEASFKNKARIIGEKDRITFLEYWYHRKGILTVISDGCDFNSLKILGIPHAKLTYSRGNDKEVFSVLKTENRPLRVALEELEPLVVTPPKKYIEVDEYESKGTDENWTIFSIYENRNNEDIGIYLNWGYKFSDTDVPAFLILPAFNNYSQVITKLLKAYAQVYPEYFSEISDLEWTKSDKYYPKEVSLVDSEIKQIAKDAEGKIKTLHIKKAQLKQEYAFLRDLLVESGDKLKEAVIRILTDVFKLKAEDMDKDKKNNFREDILIQNSSLEILAEVKGTTNSYPSFIYISQVFSNLLKERGKYPNAIGGLILNLDREKEPSERSNAYTKADEEKQLTEIVYIDTRVLFNLSIAIIDYGMSLTEAKSILLKKGRVEFDLNKYIKGITAKE